MWEPWIFTWKKRIKKPTLEPLIVNNEQVAQTTTYKYLGVTIDNKLNWHSHTSLIHKKAHKRLFFLRKLKSFGIDNKLIELFYHATIESIIVFCITSWGGNIRIRDQTNFDRLIKKQGEFSKATPHHLRFYIKPSQSKENSNHLFWSKTSSLTSNTFIFQKEQTSLLKNQHWKI